MYLYVFIGFLILAIVSCQNQPHKIADEIVETNINTVTVSRPKANKATVEELEASFSDDSNVGVPRKNKIEFSQFKKLEDYIIEIKFYSLTENNEWKLKQTLEFKNKESLNCRPQLQDFNNDGLKDFTYVSAYAARGANDIRRLFIYDGKKDELIYIKNSEEYPNMQYNKKLDCIDTWRFHGGYATEFLKIDGDILKEFARVETRNEERKIYSIDKNGKEKLLRTDKMKTEDGFIRYENFNPPEPYE